MKLIKSKKASENYLSKIVKIDTFRKHNDPEVNKLKCCTIDGFNMITGIESEPGLYVYFPALSQINNDFLSYANLYKHKGMPFFWYDLYNGEETNVIFGLIIREKKYYVPRLDRVANATAIETIEKVIREYEKNLLTKISEDLLCAVSK